MTDDVANASDTGFSVVIPLYNKRDYIRSTLESALAQHWPRFEVIVIDDGSTDGSAEAIADLADDRLRIVRQPNAGVAAARNRGIEEANHAWVAFLDADDEWRPNHLRELAAGIAPHPDAGIVATRVQQVRNGRMVEGDDGAPRAIRAIDYFSEAARDILVVHTSATAVRRAVVQAIGGFSDLRPGQDIDCWSRIALVSPVIVSNQQTALYRRDVAGAMVQWSRNKKMRRDIGRLQDFGGAVRSLADALATRQYEDRRSGIESYIDARIISGARKCIASDDLANARRRLRFVHRKTSRAFLSTWLLAMLPPNLVEKGLAARRAVRRR